MSLKLRLSADLLVSIAHVLERAISGGASVTARYQDWEIEASIADKGQKISIEIRPYKEVSNGGEEKV